MLRRLIAAGCWLGIAVCGATLVMSHSDRALAQTARPPIKKPMSKSSTKTVTPAQAQELEQRAKKTQEEFLKESVELAKDFEDAGLFEEAKKVLEVVHKLNNDLPGLKDKIASLNDSMLSTNKTTFELDVSKGWGDPVGRVEKGRAFRIEATGTYKFITTLTVGPKGFATEELPRDMAGGVRCGALVALIVPVDAKGKPGKPLDPIEVGDSRDIKPQESGLLFINVNLPPGHKSIGKIDVLLSGYIARPTK